MHEAFSKVLFEAKYSLWIKSRTGETRENFPQCKAVPSFGKRLREYVMEDILSICANSKVLTHVRCFRLSWTLLVRDNFDNVKTSSCQNDQ